MGEQVAELATRLLKKIVGDIREEVAEFTGLELKNLTNPIRSIKNSVLFDKQEYTSSSTSNVCANGQENPRELPIYTYI